MVSHQDLFGGHSVFHTEAPPPYPTSQMQSYPPVGGFSQATYPTGAVTAPVVGSSSYPPPVVAGSAYSPERQRKMVSQSCGVIVSKETVLTHKFK